MKLDIYDAVSIGAILLFVGFVAGAVWFKHSDHHTRLRDLYYECVENRPTDEGLEDFFESQSCRANEMAVDQLAPNEQALWMAYAAALIRERIHWRSVRDGECQYEVGMPRKRQVGRR